MARAARSPSSLRRWASALALAGLLGAAPVAPALSREAVPAAGKPQTGLRIIPLSIETADGKRHAYKVEVAATPQQQAHGMMFRTSVPPGTGMFFPMEPPRAASFWMENTLIPLDLIFIGADGRIRNIVAGAVPGSRAPLASVGPVVAVLELRGGEAERIGARPGDMIIWPR